MSEKDCLLFIDESGVSNLNRKSDLFVMSAVLIKKKDYEIVEGNLHLLKRRFLGNDFTHLHANEIFETPGTGYPQLSTTRLINQFLQELGHLLSILPYQVKIFSVDKQKLCAKLGYTPQPKRKSESINTDMPYELASLEAIKNHTQHLVEQDCAGEIIIESRLFSDTMFVSYFDKARQQLKRGGVEDVLAKATKNRITSLVFSNKKQNSAGLELADLCGYLAYRKKVGDPDGRVSVPQQHIGIMHGIIKKHPYVIDGAKTFLVNL